MIIQEQMEKAQKILDETIKKINAELQEKIRGPPCTECLYFNPQFNRVDCTLDVCHTPNSMHKDFSCFRKMESCN